MSSKRIKFSIYCPLSDNSIVSISLSVNGRCEGRKEIPSKSLFGSLEKRVRRVKLRLLKQYKSNRLARKEYFSFLQRLKDLE